jgi:hypothetical protein
MLYYCVGIRHCNHNQDYIDALLNCKDGKRGFLALMDNLFSPDGYTEVLTTPVMPFSLFLPMLWPQQPSLISAATGYCKKHYSLFAANQY